MGAQHLALLGALATVASAVPLAATCDRAALEAGANAYVAAQTAGNLDALKAVLAGNWSYVENNKVTDATKAPAVLTKALKIDSRRTNYDMVECATYTEIIVTDSKNPYVIGTQIHHSADQKVALIDSVASTTNSWLFNAAKTLEYVVKEKWDIIPEARRDKREVIKAAGDAYMDLWSDDKAEAKIPFGTPCVRLEGSAYTGKGLPTDSCKAGLPSNHKQAPNSNRRYVIDEAMGSVSILCVWEHMMNAADQHEFRLEDGKLRYVHTMTVCPNNQVCRL